MKRDRIFIFTMIILLLGFSGCDEKEFLEIENVPDLFLWKDLQSFELAVNAPFSVIAQMQWGGPIGEMEWYSNASGDIGQLTYEGFFNGPYDVYYNRLHRTTPIIDGRTGSRLKSIFIEMYKSINNSNDALDWLEKQEAANSGKAFPEASQSDYDLNIPRMKAQLNLYRGIAYFYLTFFFTPPYDPSGANDLKLLPYKPNFVGDAAELRETELASSQQLYDLIISSMEEAKRLMPKSYHSMGKPDYYTICGWLERMYFITGQFDKAEAECTEIIESGKYPLQDDPLEAWNKAPEDSPASETIWEFVVSPLVNGIFIPEFTFCSRCQPWGAKNGAKGEDWNFTAWVIMHLSDTMLKYVDWMKDPENGDYTETENARMDKRYNNTYLRLEATIEKPDTMSEVYYKNHYQTTYNMPEPQVWNDKYFRGVNGQNTKFPLMRSAEFYLSRSIIRYMDGDKEGAAADLKVIRDRAGLPVISAGEITEDDIHRERVKEIGDENGDRLQYLIALRKPIGLADRNPNGSEGSAYDAPYSDFYFMIPDAEVRNNGAYPVGWQQ